MTTNIKITDNVFTTLQELENVIGAENFQNELKQILLKYKNETIEEKIIINKEWVNNNLNDFKSMLYCYGMKLSFEKCTTKDCKRNHTCWYTHSDINSDGWYKHINYQLNFQDKKYKLDINFNKWKRYFFFNKQKFNITTPKDQITLKNMIINLK